MKNKILLVSILVIAFILVFSSSVLAKNDDAGEKGQIQQQARNGEQNDDSVDDEDNEKLRVEEHRSSVANFVQNLLQVANRDGGIGEKVRAIAQEQNKAKDDIVNLVEKVQKRSKIKAFLFGSDYKNLGKLRSNIVQTKNRLEQLSGLVEQAQNEADKTELQNQIKSLEQEQEKVGNFIKDNESKFSLFGWLTKIFAK